MEFDSILQAMDRYGVSAVMLAIFIMISWWVLRRFLNKTDGILTLYVAGTTEQQASLAATLKQQADTGENIAGLMTSMNKRVAGVEASLGHMSDVYYDPDSHISSVPLHRSFRNACDVIGHMCDKLEVSDSTAPLLDVMRRELDRHASAQPIRSCPRPTNSHTTPQTSPSERPAHVQPPEDP